MARTIFGSSETIIEEIENDSDDQPLIVLTDRFRIICPNALQKNEVSISPPSKATFKASQAEKELIENLEFYEQKFLEGFFDVMERENSKLAAYKTGYFMMKTEGRWNPAS